MTAVEGQTVGGDATHALFVPVVLSGYGPVGQALADHLMAHRAALGRAYGVRPSIVAVRASATQCDVPAGGYVPARSTWRPLAELAETLNRTGARVLLQALPSSPELAEIAAAEAEIALRRGVHVVTATKSHLLGHWRRLATAAAAGGVMIRVSGATGAALPAGDLSRSGMRGMGCTAMRGCPNGTATFVLDRLAAGISLGAAVKDAQRRGIAEADPSADLSGADAATKLRLLAALAWGWDPAETQVATDPIDEDTTRVAWAAASSGHRLRAVARAEAARPGVVEVRLETTEPGDPLHTLVGPEKAVVFGCPDAGDVVVSGGRSSPLGAALAMIKDTIDVTAPRRGFA